MRILVSAVFGLLSPMLPAMAHQPVVNACMVDADQPCTLTIGLPDFQPLPGRPVVIDGGVLKLVGADAGGQVRTVELSLADGNILAEQPFDLVLEDITYQWALMSPDGQTLAIHYWDGGQDRGIQFYDADGAALGRVEGGPGPAWAYDEYTMTETFGIFGFQGLVSLTASEMRVAFYRFEMVAQVADGRFELRELSQPQYEGDTLQAYLDRRFGALVGPGAEAVNWQGPLEAVIIGEGDGRAEELLVRSDHGAVWFDQRLSVDRDAYLVNSGYRYAEAHLSPDLRQLAVIRFANDGTGAVAQVMVFDVGTTYPVFTAPLAFDEAGLSDIQLVWLSDDQLGVLGSVGDGGSRLFVLETPDGG
jgi:hypothetical protein